MNVTIGRCISNPRMGKGWRLGAVAAALTVALTTVIGTTVSASPGSRQEVDAFDISSFADVGEAFLERSDNGITASISVEGADPGVYTMWWIIANHPEECDVPYACGLADLRNPDVGAAIGHGGGAVVNSSGKLKVTAHLSEGEELTGFPVDVYSALPPPFDFQFVESTLIDSRNAQIQITLRSHGEKIPGLVDEALQTLQGACTYAGTPFDGTQPTYGIEGPNICEDHYTAGFLSENAP